MRVFAYANCQGKAYTTLLPRLIEGVTVNHVENYVAMQNPSSIAEIASLARQADIFVYQPVVAEHGVFSTDENIDGGVWSYLKSSCVKISFPYIYNDGLWPLVEENGRYKGAGVIEDLLTRGLHVEEVIRSYKSGQLDFTMKQRFDDSIAILSDKEESCSIKVSKFLSENLRDKMLLRTQNHPTTFVFAHIIGQFLEQIEIMNNNLKGSLDDIRNSQDNNIVNLPSCWPIDNYSISSFDLKYANKPDDGAEEYYIDCIKKIAGAYEARSMMV